MRRCATYDDINLVLHLYELRREERLREARSWFTRNFHAKTWEEFESLCPAGSEENESFRMVTTYWEMVASFITADVLEKNVFFESGREMLLVWERMKAIVPPLREKNSDPSRYENIEKVAGEFAEWLENKAPGTYPAFVKRMTGR